jgi:hypothetical protein
MLMLDFPLIHKRSSHDISGAHATESKRIKNTHGLHTDVDQVEVLHHNSTDFFLD